MSNEVMVPGSANGIVTINVTPRQKAWVTLSDVKTKLEESLQKQELELQAMINLEFAMVSAEALEKTLDEYRKKWTAMKNQRMAFTNIVDEKIVQALMQYEKRSAPEAKFNEKFGALEKQLLDAKIKAKEANNAQTEKQKEEAAYTAHIKNQYEIQVATFKKQAYNEIYTMYQQALTGGQPELKTEVAKTISELQFVELVKYPRKFVTNEEATEIYKKIPKPTVTELRKQMILELEKMWQNYENDKAGNINVQQELEEQVANIEQQTTQATSINTMLAKSEASTPVVMIGAGKKKLKETMSIEGDDTLGWALKVIIAFANTPQSHGYLKAKIAKNIKVEQMADALAELAANGGARIDGLKYVTLRRL